MKKEVKNTNNLGTCVSGCSRSQKVWGVIALGGLFACGWMVGVGVNSIRTTVAQAVVDQEEKNATKIVPLVTPPRRDCELVEETLWERIGKNISTNDVEREYKFLEMMWNNGCPENRDAYQKKMQALEKVRAFNTVSAVDKPASQEVARTCTKIEQELSIRLSGANEYMNADNHISNAKIYANLSERGCPENSEKYVTLARQELELARALEDDMLDPYEAQEVVQTYKRLHMKAAAEDVFNKVKKLTDPAIDFILEIEKIINE